MPHILIGGSIPADVRLRDCLRRWGVTMGSLPSGFDPEAPNTLAECDVVLLLCGRAEEDAAAAVPPRSTSGRKPDSNGEPAAPLLVVGTDSVAEMLGPWAYRQIPRTGPDGLALRSALEDCLAKAAELAGASTGGEDRDRRLNFLGHELRSPLTAIKTALEVLQGDLGGLDAPGSPRAEGGGSPASSLRMLEIALRNVRRLHHTVESSQGLLRMSGPLPESAPRPVTVGELCEGFSHVARVHASEADRDLVIECDPCLLVYVSEQAARAVKFADPAVGVNLVVRVELDVTPRLRLEFSREERQVASAAGDCEDLERLAGYLIPGGVTSRLSAQLRAENRDRQSPSLILTLPVTAARHRTESPAV